MAQSKKYSVYMDRGVYKVKWEGGGQLAKSLSGGFTSRTEIEKAIATTEAAKFPGKRKERVISGKSKNTD